MFPPSIQCQALHPFTLRYIYLDRTLVASQEDLACKTAPILTQYHHSDALGSVVARTDSTAQITDRTASSPTASRPT